MKFHFDDNLEHQMDAIKSTVDIFKGQETCRAEFSVTKWSAETLSGAKDEFALGIGNRL